MGGGFCQGPLCTLPLSLFTGPNFQCVPSRRRQCTNSVVFSAYTALSSALKKPNHWPPSFLTFLSFGVSYSHICRVPFFYFQLVSSGCSTMTHSAMPGTQWTLKSICGVNIHPLNLGVFLQPSFPSSHTWTSAFTHPYSPFADVSRALALGPRASQRQTHLPSRLIDLSTWLYSDTSNPASPKSASVHLTAPNTPFPALLRSS